MYINTTYKFNDRSNELTNFLKSNDDGVFYIGHASILVRLSGKKFIFDAVHQTPPYLNSWHFFPSQIMDERLFDVDAAFISHVHQDHYDTKFLKKLQKNNIPIYIVNGRVNFNKLLKENGIKFKTISAGKKTKFDKEIWFTGCLHEYNSIDSSIIISNNKFTVYHGNDNYVTEKSLKPLKKIAGKIDVGCIPFSFIHWYPFLLDGVTENWRKKEGKRLINKFLELGLTQCKILKPSLVIPFGANLVYADDFDSEMNKAVVSPIDFVNFAQKRDPKNKEKYLKIFSGGYILKKNKKLDAFYEKVSKSKFNYLLKKFLDSSNSNADFRKKVNINLNGKGNFDWIENRIKKNPNKIDYSIVLEDEHNPSKTMLKINIKTSKVSTINKTNNLKNCHYFKLNSFLFNEWLQQKISFEEVIGTRRFRLERIPNVYRVDINEVYLNYL